MSREVLRALRDRAEALLQPGQELAVATDAHTDPTKVAIAFARPTHSWVMLVDRREYDGVALARVLDFELAGTAARPTAQARASAAQAAKARPKELLC